MSKEATRMATGDRTKSVSITLPMEVYASFAVIAEFANHEVARELREQLVSVWRSPEFGALLRRCSRKNLSEILEKYSLTQDEIEEIVKKAYSRD